jgi:KaiC/GvpD/RAD55 family RecA-like ATPase
VRIKTGLPTLDEATRGGIPCGKLLIFGGAPGAAKTGTVTSIAHRVAQTGIQVAILAADEDADGLLTRIGQIEGFDRLKIEERDPETVAALASRLASLNLLLVDADEDGASLEEVAEELARRANGGPAVLGVDSLQRIRAKGTREAKTVRERVDCAVEAVKRVTKRYGFVTLVTSELARGSYRSQDASEQINDLAAFKETGGIEYGASLALVMRSRKGTPDIVDVTMPKNRLGPKRDFVLRWDFERATATERHEDRLDPLADLKSQILLAEVAGAGYLLTKPQSRRAVYLAVGGNRDRFKKAVDELVDDGRLVEAEDGKVVLADPRSSF